MTRALLFGIVAIAGMIGGFGCSVICADCNCGDGTSEVAGAITAADRAELVGGTVSVRWGGVTIDYTRSDGTKWEMYYSSAAQ
jgi:hypothetical protein